MANSSRFRSRSNRSPRQTDWSLGPQARDESLSATGLSLWTLGATPIVDGETIVRTHGIFSIFLRSVGAVGDGYFGAFGLAKVTDKAFAIGTTAIPGPLTEVDWDGWFVHRFFDVRAVTATIGDGANAGYVSQRIMFDSKAMRKVDETEVVVGVVEVVESGASVFEYHAEARHLIKPF